MSTDQAIDVAGHSPAPDSVARFAADLRQIRLEAESPTLVRLQHDTGISKSVLSDAFTGQQLPSARTVAGIVRACGGDPRTWLERRDELARARRGGDAPALAPEADDDDAEVAAPSRPDRSVTRRSAAWLAAGAFGAGALGSAVTVIALIPLLTGTGPSGPRIAAQNGTDPAQTACLDDARVATGDTRADNSLLEIVWSDACQAGWGRITRYDGLSSGNTVTIAIYPETSPDGPDRQEAVEQDVQGAYTALVVRPSPDTLLCAEGSFTVDGKRIDLGDPLCI